MKPSSKESVMYNITNNGPYKKPFTRDWEGLEKWLFEKMFHLSKEYDEFQKREKVTIEKIDKKLSKVLLKLSDEETRVYNSQLEWMQQIGKITFIFGILVNFFKEEKDAKKIIEDRGWKIL